MLGDSETKQGSSRHEFYRLEDEIMFLRERLLAVEYELEERLSGLNEEYADRGNIPAEEQDITEAHRLERDTINELLHSEREESLDRVLARRLQTVQRKLMEVRQDRSDSDTYPALFWRYRIEQQILSDLLRLWWEWRRGQEKD